MVSKYPMNAAPRSRPDIPRPRPHKPFAPRPAGWPVRPIPKIPPLPKSATFLIGKSLGKLAARAVPGLGTAILLYEIYDYYKVSKSVPSGWVRTCKYTPNADYNGTSPSRQTYTTYPTEFCYFYGDAVRGLFDPLGTAVPDAATHVITLHRANAPYAHYTMSGETWFRTVPGAPWQSPGTVPAFVPNPNLMPNPEPNPTPAPYQPPQRLPIGRPNPFPNTSPRPVPRPNPGEQPANQPKPKARPRPGREKKPDFHPIPTMPFPVILYPTPGNGVPFPQQPDLVVDIKPPSAGGRPNRPPIVRQRPNSATNKPNPRKTKGRKPNVVSVAPGTWALINVFTEGVDFLNVLYDALPEDSVCRKAAQKGGRPASQYQKAKAVYNCFSQIDVSNAIEGYVNNQVEDFVYGALGQVQSKATRGLNITTGLNRAIKKQQELATGDGPGIGDLIPRIDIDDETGELTVTVPQFGSVGFGAFGDGKVTTKRPR